MAYNDFNKRRDTMNSEKKAGAKERPLDLLVICDGAASCPVQCPHKTPHTHIEDVYNDNAEWCDEVISECIVSGKDQTCVSI